MKRVKERWDQYYPKYWDASWQKLRGNAARFKKKSEVINLMLVRRKKEIQQEEARNREDLPEENHKPRSDISNNGTNDNVVVDEQADKLAEDGKERERFFQIQI